MVDPVGSANKRGKHPNKLYYFSREMRKDPTEAENLLWDSLRNRQLSGWKFRRQHPFPPFILDFYCIEARLSIELDGSGHKEPEQRKFDRERTQFLKEQGITEIRFWNEDVIRDLDSVVRKIYESLPAS